MREIRDLGKWTEAELDDLLRAASAIADTGERITFLSGRLLGTPYGARTLVGGPDAPETLVINLGEVDCFTFIDYVEAMRRSSSFADFAQNLRSVRYTSGEVSYGRRNHFFTDWREHNAGFLRDATESISPGRCVKVVKTLNLRSDGSAFVPGIPPVRREVCLLPIKSLDGEALARLRSGDYAGVCSADEGLDVSHVGIVVKEPEGVLLRHASSRAGTGQVIDEDLLTYLADKPGLIVLRPKP